jgi:glycosyltransferase involved in cell wall biosynthesis
VGQQLSPWKRSLFRRAYFFPDVAIKLSEQNPDDGRFLQAKNEFIVPNGIDDRSLLLPKKTSDERSFCRLLYVGIVKESKGILTLLDACRILKEKGLDFKLTVVGRFASRDFENDVTARVNDYRLEEFVEFAGVLTGREKYAMYRRADIFCFPTFHENESFGIVLIEAMQFSLPVLSTKWRGVPSVVRDGISGFCVPIGDEAAIADKLESLIKNPDLRRRMGEEGREIYLNAYSREKFQSSMREVFLSAAGEF